MKKRHILQSLMLAAVLSSLTGCIALPPLINVTHKESPPVQVKDPNPVVLERLDSIDKRLKRLEEKVEKQP